MFKQLLSLLSKDDLISQAYDDMQTMLQKSQTLYYEAVASLTENREASFDIYKLDKEINSYEKKIRRKVLEHLSVNPQQDIMSSLVLTSIVISIERIGDYSKNIYEVLGFFKKGEVLTIHETLVSTQKTISGSFPTIADALHTGDIESAQKLIVTLDPLRKILDSYIYNDAVNNPVKDTRVVITNVLYSRYLKRVAAHLENIATSIVNPFHKIGFFEEQDL